LNRRKNELAFHPGGQVKFVPVIDTFLKEHFLRTSLVGVSFQIRSVSLRTIAALTSLGGTESSYRSPIYRSAFGITESKLEQMLSIVETSIGKKEQMPAGKVLSKVIAARRIDFNKSRNHWRKSVC